MQKQEQGSVDVDMDVDSLVCPSFNSYSSDNLVDVVGRVTGDKSSDGDVGYHGDNNNDNDASSLNNNNDFEFVTFRKAADGVFFDGYVGPVFPVFNRDLLREDESRRGHGLEAEKDVMALQFSMRRLLNIGDDDQWSGRDPPSSSSSDVDELEAIPPGSYCVWTPNSAKASPNRCKKSNSTGSSSSSKRWKLLDLLRRSSSDGKKSDSFLFLTPSLSSVSNLLKKKEHKSVKSYLPYGIDGKQKGNESAIAASSGKKKTPLSAHEAFYVRNKELKKLDKRKSYLPYRQDLVGFCVSLNGTSRKFPPF